MCCTAAAFSATTTESRFAASREPSTLTYLLPGPRSFVIEARLFEPGATMDLRAYFRKVHEIESTIEGDYAVVVSLETPDGGREGCLTEVTRAVAARLIVDGKARLAADTESREFYLAIARDCEEALRRDVAERINVTLVTDRPLPEPRTRGRQPKNQDK